MKKLLALVILLVAVAAIAGYLNRETIQEKVDEKIGGMGEPDTDELLREEEAAAPAVMEPA